MSVGRLAGIAIILLCGCGDSHDEQRDGASGCVPSVENCFNGIDDDCNGFTDCGDPACVGGVDPVAICVPDPGLFTPGVMIDASTSCPTEWPTSIVVNAGLAHSCGQGTCACGLPSSACSTRIFNDGGNAACPQATSVVLVNQSTCSAAFAIAAGSFHSTGAVWTGVCAANGTATKVTSWSESQRFCSGATVGVGCTLASVCVPRATNHCVIAAGSQTCPANYVPRPQYFTDVDDMGRSCQCSCAAGAGGTCAGTSVVTLFTGANCMGTSTALSNACSNSDISTFTTAMSTGLTPVGGSCAANTIEVGAAMPIGEQTVCCTQ